MLSYNNKYTGRRLAFLSTKYYCYIYYIKLFDHTDFGTIFNFKISLDENKEKHSQVIVV